MTRDNDNESTAGWASRSTAAVSWSSYSNRRSSAGPAIEQKNYLESRASLRVTECSRKRKQNTWTRNFYQDSEFHNKCVWEQVAANWVRRNCVACITQCLNNVLVNVLTLENASCRIIKQVATKTIEQKIQKLYKYNHYMYYKRSMYIHDKKLNRISSCLCWFNTRHNPYATRLTFMLELSISSSACASSLGTLVTRFMRKRPVLLSGEILPAWTRTHTVLSTLSIDHKAISAHTEPHPHSIHSIKSAIQFTA